jgi:coenzyme F420-reducing hydrogenase delta subunit
MIINPNNYDCNGSDLLVNILKAVVISKEKDNKFWKSLSDTEKAHVFLNSFRPQVNEFPLEN